MFVYYMFQLKTKYIFDYHRKTPLTYSRQIYSDLNNALPVCSYIFLNLVLMYEYMRKCVITRVKNINTYEIFVHRPRANDLSTKNSYPNIFMYKLVGTNKSLSHIEVH
jgi:hypothetical protein